MKISSEALKKRRTCVPGSRVSMPVGHAACGAGRKASAGGKGEVARGAETPWGDPQPTSQDYYIPCTISSTEVEAVFPRGRGWARGISFKQLLSVCLHERGLGWERGYLWVGGQGFPSAPRIPGE